jgi:prepilin-type N-terminal cleavage/methylation domain-containing protein
MQLNKLAFTLIELLVVIAVIGILSGLIVVSMSGTSDKARFAKLQIFSSSLRNSLMSNLISEWKLDDVGSSMNDSWGGGNTGSLTGFSDTSEKIGDTTASGWMSSTNCISGTCLKFDGSDDYVTIPNNSNTKFTNAITIEAWVKPFIISSQHELLNKQNSYEFQIGSSRARMCFATNEVWHFTQSSNTVLAINNWYHLVGSYDSSINTVKLYVNGNLDATDTTTTTGLIKTNNIDLQIAYYNSSFPNRFSGIIDNIRLYGAAVPASKIKENYYLGLNELLIGGKITTKEYLSRINEYAVK